MYSSAKEAIEAIKNQVGKIRKKGNFLNQEVMDTFHKRRRALELPKGCGECQNCEIKFESARSVLKERHAIHITLKCHAGKDPIMQVENLTLYDIEMNCSSFTPGEPTVTREN